MSSTPRAKPKSKEVEGASPRASKPKADGDKKPKAKKPKGAAPADRESVCVVRFMQISSHRGMHVCGT